MAVLAKCARMPFRRAVYRFWRCSRSWSRCRPTRARISPSRRRSWSRRSTSRTQHPENVHSYIDRLKGVRGRPELVKLATAFWFEKQAEVFGGLLRVHAAAESRGRRQDPKVRAVLDLYTESLKVAFLEELIVLGEMAPSAAGLRSYVAGIPAERRRRIDTGAADDSELTPPEEQRRMKQRWVAFRRDVLAAAEQANRCHEVTSLDLPEETVLVEVNQRDPADQRHRQAARPPAARRGGGLRGGCARRLRQAPARAAPACPDPPRDAGAVAAADRDGP